MEVERSIEHLSLDHEQLLKLVQRAFPDCRQLEDYQLLSGGALNTTYKFRIENDAFVLRLYARDRMACQIEKSIHSLIDGKVSTPKLIYADETRAYPYAIFQFIPGKHPWDVSQDDKAPLSFELGSTLASIHAFKFNQAGISGTGMAIVQSFEAGSSPYFEEAFRRLSQGELARDRLGDQLADEMLEFIQKNKEFFPRVGKNICLTHSDFKPVNLLYSQRKVFVLDWEFAHAGIGILDFSILLRHRNQFPLDLELLKKGYIDSGGTLPEEWLRSALITDFVNIAQLLNIPSERPKLFHELKNAAQTTMDHWDFLVK
jgi:aminoglycoside phosphotransferase (APT) family kinase protein